MTVYRMAQTGGTAQREAERERRRKRLARKRDDRATVKGGRR